MAAIIGGLVTALVIFVGMSGFEGGSGDVTIREAPPPAEGAVGDGAGPPVREVYTKSGPGVVSVDVASSELGPSGGSGFVLDEQGHIVTNQHVVEGAEEVSVRFASGVRERAEIVGEDPSTDVAVVKVDASEG
ncbi:MAG: trypsin-like peptidase domain-containing protein, partial [Actinomycetota bacterium]|nr:trypsin-like peptidase domain-containing protein [Actinomycetota bacterium]